MKGEGGGGYCVRRRTQSMKGGGCAAVVQSMWLGRGAARRCFSSTKRLRSSSSCSESAARASACFWLLARLVVEAREIHHFGTACGGLLRAR